MNQGVRVLIQRAAQVPGAKGRLPADERRRHAAAAVFPVFVQPRTIVCLPAKEFLW